MKFGFARSRAGNFGVASSLPAAPDIDQTSPLSDATDGQAYSNQLTTTGGLTPVVYTVTSGTLPSGITLSSSGLLSGTHSGTGQFTFTITATEGLLRTNAVAFTLDVVTAGFSDAFAGSASDPALDATTWTETVRTGASTGVNVGSNGLMQCTRINAGAGGAFGGFVTTAYENATTDTIILTGLRFANYSRAILYCKAANKTATAEGGAGNTGICYGIQLSTEDDGTAGQLTMYTDGSARDVGLPFAWTGVGATAANIKIVITKVAGVSVTFTFYVNDVLLTTRTDTNAARKETAGYTGFIEVTTTSGTSIAELGAFSVNA